MIQLKFNPEPSRDVLGQLQSRLPDNPISTYGGLVEIWGDVTITEVLRALIDIDPDIVLWSVVKTDDIAPISEELGWRTEVAKLESVRPEHFIGIYFAGDGARKCWRITCPCGVSVEYPVNKLPEVDTPHPCGNADHWIVQYGPDATPNARPAGMEPCHVTV